MASKPPARPVAHPRSRVVPLLEKLRDDFPAYRREVERIFWEGAEGQFRRDEVKPVTLEIGPAEPVDALPTFDPAVSRPLTPMLADRFAFAGAIRRGGSTQLAPGEIRRWMDREEIRRSFESLRGDWADSAPMLFADDRLTLFEVHEGLSNSQGFLVWKVEGAEPEVWTYSGMSSWKFDNYERYLEWATR